MGDQVKSCVVCAWRENCQKKFFLSSTTGQVNCPDFSLDVSLKKGNKTQDKDKDK